MKIKITDCHYSIQEWTERKSFWDDCAKQCGDHLQLAKYSHKSKNCTLMITLWQAMLEKLEGQKNG